MENLILLSKNNIIGKYVDGKFEVINSDLLPIFLRRKGDFLTWLELRAVDEHRSTSRFIKKAMRLENKDDLSTVLKVNAVTITDTYWVKPETSSLTYEDVVFD